MHATFKSFFGWWPEQHEIHSLDTAHQLHELLEQGKIIMAQLEDLNKNLVDCLAAAQKLPQAIADAVARTGAPDLSNAINATAQLSGNINDALTQLAAVGAPVTTPTV
jgi:ABC-type transporter Mla subunit MlaD